MNCLIEIMNMDFFYVSSFFNLSSGALGSDAIIILFYEYKLLRTA